MVILKHIEASVVVDGQSLVEYDEDVDEMSETLGDDYSVVKCVEAISGAHFKVRLEWDSSRLKRCDGLQFQVYLDAMSQEGVLCDGQSGNLDSFEGSGLASIGKIVVSVYRVTNIRKSTNVTTTLNVQTGSSVSESIPEKALKGRALSHIISLDPPEKTSAFSWVDCDYVDKLRSPFVNFEFRYRSRKALQIEGIIPRSPSPVPLEDRPVESLTREEAIELLARRTVSFPGQFFSGPLLTLGSQAQTKPEIKPEPSTKRRIKRERDPEYDQILASSYVPKKARASQDIEVIDLVDD
ncbi:hypothetical protein MMC26_006407 [Xylographa opegraphella]|nr:hypothetical protein [Xylographa opegraphella]